MDITDLKLMSFEVGNNRLLVQGAGGNTSFKSKDKMYIKASGKWLSNSLIEDIFVPVNFNKIRENIINNLKNPLEKSIEGKNDLRPSIETTLHALMNHKVVLHLHPVDLLSWVIREDAEEKLRKILKGLNWEWIPYAKPGKDLTNEVCKVTKENQKDILVLGNHGLVIGGDSCKDVLILMQQVLERCKVNIEILDLNPGSQLAEFAKLLGMRLPKFNLVHSLAINKKMFICCAKGSGVLYPDQAVFLGAKMNCFSNINPDLTIKNIYDQQPEFALIEGQGVLLKEDANPILDEMLLCHSETLMRANLATKLRYLKDNEVAELLNWEPEKYRRSLESLN
jgi:rhamnose utilization protein RhaD (predicted bifunctional aldolase and dehydrogenase)